MTSTVKDKYDALIEEEYYPLRVGTPEDIAGVVSLLASPRCVIQLVEIINVDGGYHIRRL